MELQSLRSHGPCPAQPVSFWLFVTAGLTFLYSIIVIYSIPSPEMLGGWGLFWVSSAMACCNSSLWVGYINIYRFLLLFTLLCIQKSSLHTGTELGFRKTFQLENNVLDQHPKKYLSSHYSVHETRVREGNRLASCNFFIVECKKKYICD